MNAFAKIRRTRKMSPKQMEKITPKKRLPKVTLDDMLSFYESLAPDTRTKLRQEIMKRAGNDEFTKITQQLEEAKAAKTAPRATNLEAHFEPFSDQIIKYLKDIKSAWSLYLPTDNYKPGDENGMDLRRSELLHAMEPLEWILKSYFRYEVKGLENMPETGRAMIISNHGILPLDGWFLFYEIMRQTDRWPRGLTDWRIYKFPYLRQFFMDMGMIVGSHENGDRLLQNEELIFIMPGGSREAWKSSQFRYRLLWQGRYGFIRMALRNRCPIVPSANVGTDDTYYVLFNGYMTSYRLFRTRKALLPISLPVGLGVLPFPAKMTQYVGEPIVLPYPPEAANDPAILAECQNLVKSRVYELIDRGLAERNDGDWQH